MGKRKDISEAKIAEIQSLLLHTKHSQRQIATISNVSQATVNNIKKKINMNESFGPQRIGKSGRKRLTTPRDERQIRNICLENRKKPRRVLTKLIQEAGIPISDMTVRRRLREQGFQARRPAKKPKLTEAMRKKRLQWAKQLRNWTKEDWEKVCFSDESSIEILMDKSAFVRRRAGEKYHPDCIVERVKHPLKIMVWSVISARGTGHLYIVEGTMRQDQYIRVLETKLLPQIGEWFPNNEEYVFVHDSAPCHKAKSVTAFLTKKKIEVLPWPGNSPDMNPIENLWELLKRGIASEIITNKQQLIEKLISVWHHDAGIKENCRKNIESMPRRIQAIIDAKGGMTKY